MQNHEFLAGAHEKAVALLGHKACGVLIGLMGAAGMVAALIRFF